MPDAEFIKAQVKAPRGWSDVLITINVPSHLIEAMAQTLAENIEHGTPTRINLLIAEYGGEQYKNDVVFETFALRMAEGSFENVCAEIRPDSDDD